MLKIEEGILILINCEKRNLQRFSIPWVYLNCLFVLYILSMFSVSDHLTFHLRILNLSGIKLAEINHDICIILVVWHFFTRNGYPWKHSTTVGLLYNQRGLI